VTTRRQLLVFADTLPECADCGEAWCPKHEEHYYDCACVGPHNAADLGYDVQEIDGKFYAVPKKQP
jgi:hypothetical protein